MSSNHHWTAADVPDQEGRTAIITGANSGIGFEAARVLARKGGRIVLASRNPEKNLQARQVILAETPDARLYTMNLDLADLASIHTFSQEFLEDHNRLDLLINNAGVMALPERRETSDGFEMQFGTNHLGHFALTGLLSEVLIQTPGARVVTISSGAHRFGRMNFDDLNSRSSYSRWGAYGQSKLANLLFAFELQRRFEAAGLDVLSVAAHPGYAATNLQSTTGLFQFLNHLMAQTAEMGALPTLYAATGAEIEGGDYAGPGGFMEQRGYPVKVESSPASHDREDASKLWGISEELTGVRYQFVVESPESMG